MLHESTTFVSDSGLLPGTPATSALADAPSGLLTSPPSRPSSAIRPRPLRNKTPSKAASTSGRSNDGGAGSGHRRGNGFAEFSGSTHSHNHSRSNTTVPHAPCLHSSRHRNCVACLAKHGGSDAADDMRSPTASRSVSPSKARSRSRSRSRPRSRGAESPHPPFDGSFSEAVPVVWSAPGSVVSKLPSPSAHTLDLSSFSASFGAPPDAHGSHSNGTGPFGSPTVRYASVTPGRPTGLWRLSAERPPSASSPHHHPY